MRFHRTVAGYRVPVHKLGKDIKRRTESSIYEGISKNFRTESITK